MSSLGAVHSKSEDDEKPPESTTINKNYKLICKIERKTIGYQMKNWFLQPKCQNHGLMLRRTAWLVQCVENYMLLKNHMDDELGIRLLCLTQNPTELLNFEYQNFCRAARSGLPRKFEGTLKSYFSMTGDFCPLTLAQLSEDLGITYTINSNRTLRSLNQRNADKYRILFGSEYTVQKEMCMNRHFTDIEKKGEPGNNKKSRFAVWIGPSGNGKYREYRLDLAKLYKPKILSELSGNFVVALAQMLISSGSQSMCEGAQSVSTLLRSVTSTNAQFLIAAALSPYQALNRFLVDNFASFQAWTQDVDRSVFTVKIGETHIMDLPDIHMNVLRNSPPRDLSSQSENHLNALLTEVTTSITVQFALIKLLKWLSLNHKINTEYDTLVDVFNATTKKAYAVAQMIEKTIKTHGSIPNILMDLFQNAIYFLKDNDKSRAMPKFILKTFIEPKKVPICVRIAYLELFLEKCGGSAGLNVVKSNGRHIRDVFISMTKEERDVVLRCVC